MNDLGVARTNSGSHFPGTKNSNGIWPRCRAKRKKLIAVRFCGYIIHSFIHEKLASRLTTRTLRFKDSRSRSRLGSRVRPRVDCLDVRPAPRCPGWGRVRRGVAHPTARLRSRQPLFRASGTKLLPRTVDRNRVQAIKQRERPSKRRKSISRRLVREQREVQLSAL